MARFESDAQQNELSSVDPRKIKTLNAIELNTAREDVLSELRGLTFESKHGLKCNLYSVLMHMPGMSDAQRVRLTDVLTQVKYGTFTGSLTGPSLNRSYVALGEQLDLALDNGKFRTSSEQRILQSIFSQVRIPDNVRIIDKTLLCADSSLIARKIMTSIGYSGEQITGVCSDLATSSFKLKPFESIIDANPPSFKAKYSKLESSKEAALQTAEGLYEKSKQKSLDQASYRKEKQRFENNISEKF